MLVCRQGHAPHYGVRAYAFCGLVTRPAPSEESMGEYVIYLVPEGAVEDPIASRAKITRLLQEEGIIDKQKCAFYRDEETSSCYVVGHNNLAAFTIDENEVDVAFQRCVIY